MRWLDVASPDAIIPAQRIHGFPGSAGRSVRRDRRCNSARETCEAGRATMPTLEITMRYSPLAFLYALFQPNIAINGGQHMY